MNARLWLHPKSKPACESIFNNANTATYSCFEPPMINVLVGPARVMFLLPLKLACHKSGKLRRSHARSKIQSRSSMCFETVNVKIFQNWCRWAYGNNDLNSHDLKSLYQLYYLAADLESGDLSNAVLDSIRDHYFREKTWPKQERVVHVYKNTATASPLRKFVVSCVYHRLMILRDEVRTYFGDVAIDVDFVRDYIQYVQDSTSKAGNSDPRKREGCQYHEHESAAIHLKSRTIASSY